MCMESVNTGTNVSNCVMSRCSSENINLLCLFMDGIIMLFMRVSHLIRLTRLGVIIY